MTTAIVCDNSRTVACASDKGGVQLFRVDQGQAIAVPGTPSSTSSSDGGVSQLASYTNAIEHVLICATSGGTVRGTDLRARRETFRFQLDVELGFVTSMALGPENIWLVVGTSRGFLVLYDVRFSVVVRTWLHSSCQPIEALVVAGGANRAEDNYSRPRVFVAAGENSQVGLFDVGEGSLSYVFRGFGHQQGSAEQYRLPSLEAVERMHATPRVVNPPRASTRTVVPLLAQGAGVKGIITSGDDRQVRYWDIDTTRASYTVAGLEPGFVRPAYSFALVGGSRVFTALDSASTATDPRLAARRGPVSASAAHNDAVTAAALMAWPRSLLLTASRDGVVKAWI